ncbi:N-acetylmuramoyl-L-alanine amidase [Janibacter terrae]|uniref:N-acetylmuramoyl-L-alanine amidase n=1 Tax=Janibacter terrae TaxID=103817 RepID=A0ABZ2FCE5_9MICO|nr:N-acetylmuramoyl-L-alanine amidase [Janibacter terrae]
MSSLRRALSRLTVAATATSLITIVPVVDTSASPKPVPAQRDSIRIGGIDRSALKAAPAVPQRGRSDDKVVGMTAPTATRDFRVAGVTWSGERTDVEAFVRTRDAATGRWTGWSLLEAEGGPDAGSAEAASQRGGTQPLVTAESDGVQVRVESAGARPSDLEVDLVDPGTSDADGDVGSAPPATAHGVQRRPTVHTRAEWGADESIRKGEPDYGEVRGAVVHHTAGINTYSKDDVPQILRGIYDFHVNGRGWNDIGYNVLVDKWGRLWEGRAGGLDRAVIGAHARGVNSQTFGISAMGDYDVTAAPTAMVTGIERFMAWKLGRHHVDPTAKATIGGVWRPTVLGHRNVGQTACPGRYLQSKLSGIRTNAKERQSSAFYRPSTSPRWITYGSGGSALNVKTGGDVTWRVRIRSDEHGVISDRSSTRTGDTDLTVTWKGRLADGEWATPGEYEVILSGKDTSSGTWVPGWRDTVTVTP